MADYNTTRQIFMAYAEKHDATKLAENVVFTVMATGQEIRGREAVGQFLHYYYNVVFKAHAETRNIFIDGDHVVLEGAVVGRQLLEFAGIAPSGREVRLPLCNVYDLENDQIVRARIYMQIEALRQD